MTVHSIPHTGAVASKFTLLSLAVSTVQKWAAALAKAQARRAAIAHLESLDDRLLRDIGIDRLDIPEAVRRDVA